MNLEVYRKELKYVIPLPDFYRIRPALEACLTRDAHGEDGGYMVRSLYFDDYRDSDCRDVLAGMENKQKIRIRVYAPDAMTAKLEFKCKTGSDGRKQSLGITRREAEAMMDGRYGFLLQKDGVAKELYARMTKDVYLPKTVVEYSRSAYAYPMNDIRVTFDERIGATFDKWALFEEEPCLEPVLPWDAGVLEIKYEGFLPEFIKDIVKDINVLTVANSKYVQSRLTV